MMNLLFVLRKAGLLSPKGMVQLFSSISRYGINLMTLLYFAHKVYGNQTALVDEKETLSFSQLFEQSQILSVYLREEYGLQKGRKAAFLCKNHISLVKSIFAVSLTGADIFLLNAEMSQSQMNKLTQHNDFDFLIYDNTLHSLVTESGYTKDKILSYHDHLPAINNLSKVNPRDMKKSKRSSSGKIVILTGGTTGNYKKAVHKPSVWNFLNPCIAMLTRLKLTQLSNGYIAVPLYHGYGFAVLFLFIFLGKKTIIQYKFETKRACALIRKHRVEAVVVVPLMVHRMLEFDAEALRSLTCIASGGAELNPKLVGEVFLRLGDVLYNLYGTSEAGLSTIATPKDLRYAYNTIGKKIKGVRLRILDQNGNKVQTEHIGSFCFKNRWSMRNRKQAWINTSDLGYCDNNGYYFLCGRTDDMIVSAGENVYPAEVEQVLMQHPQIADVAVIAVRDEVFGQRLKAFVLPVKHSSMTKDEIMEWLRARVARFQLPKDIEFVDIIPYTSLGKRDRMQLH